MRVLSLNEGTYYVTLGLMEAMKQRGYQTSIFPLLGFQPEMQQHLLLRYFRHFRPDWLLTPGWSVGYFDVNAVATVMEQLRIPQVYWATEDPLFHNDVSMMFAPRCDYVFTTAEECIPRYQQLGKPSSTLLFGCNPEIFRPVDPVPEFQHDIVLVANNYTWFDPANDHRRQAIRNIVMPLCESGYDIRIWGNWWDSSESEFLIDRSLWCGLCNYLQTPAVYSSAKIVLGIQSVGDSSTQTSCRTFEIMGCGAFYLTCYTPSHERLFTNHQHLVWSRSPAETVELVDYYLSHDAERRAVAAEGRAEILRHHTYAHRLDQVESALQPLLEQRRLERGF